MIAVDERRDARPAPDPTRPPMVEYKCPCGAFLFASDATVGRIKDVRCPKCRSRRTVYLGGWRSAAEVKAARLREAG